MADQNQQMADIMQQVNYELERYGRLTGSTADALRDATVGVDGFSQAVRKAPIALTDSVGKMVKTLNTGERGAKAYNDAVSSMADAASAATTVLTAMIPGGPVVKALVMGLGKLAQAAIKASAEIYKLAAEQGDRQYDAYQKLAKSGAAAAGGTTQFAKELYKLSVPLQDLDSYVTMIGDNSQDLALFAGSVGQGVQDFANLRSTMKPFRAELERLGLSTQEQSEAVLKFISLQTRLGNAGRLQAQSYEQTALAAKRYIEEQDALTRLTGVDRKEREKNLMEALRNQRFAATLDDLERQGKKDEAKALRDSMSFIGETAGPATAKAFQDAVTGFITPESQKILMASQGVVQEQIALIKEGRVKTDKEFADSNERMVRSLGRASQDFNQLAQLGIFDKIFGPYEESRRAQQFLDKQDQDLATRILKIRQEQAAQQAGIDKRLAAQSNTRINQLDAQLEKERAVDVAVTATAKAAELASEALLAVATAGRKAAEGLLTVEQQSKGFWDRILESMGIGPRAKTDKEQALEAADAAARAAMERAEAERKVTADARKAADETLAAERKRLSEAQDKVDRAKNQLQGVGTQAGTNFEVQRLQRLEAAATAKIQAAQTTQQRSEAEREAEKVRDRLAEALAEQTKLQTIVAEQGRLAEAAKVAVEQREAALATARKTEADATKAADTATRQRLIAQSRVGFGGEKPNAQAALEADQRRRQREQDSEALVKLNRNITDQKENLKSNTDRLAKLDKTRDRATIEMLERVNETITKRTQELEAEAKTLRERIKANQAPVLPAAQPATGFGDDDTSVFPTTLPTAQPAAAQPATARPTAQPAAAQPATARPGAPATARPPTGAVPSTARPEAPKSKPMKVDQAQLEAMGLRIKKGDVQREQGDIDPRVIKLAKDIQNNLKGFVHFTGFNDNFHQENAPGSHTKGLAMDFILNRKPSAEEGKDIVSYLKELGASRVIDEYNFPSAKSTGGHFHAEVAAYAKGGIIPGPTIALMGERQPEAVVPLPDGKSIPVSMGSAVTDEMQRLAAMLQTVGQDVKRLDTPNVIRLTQQDVMAAGGIGPTMGGYNEYMGYNQGPMTTDLAVVKDIAASLGAFDRASQTITDPATWKQILGSGLATNYQMGMAEFGTKMLPGLAVEIGERIKEIITTSGPQPDSGQAVQQVAQEFRKMLQEFLQTQDNQAPMATVQLLNQLVREQQQGNDITKKMLQAVRN
jgi:hypothetical protein